MRLEQRDAGQRGLLGATSGCNEAFRLLKLQQQEKKKVEKQVRSRSQDLKAEPSLKRFVSLFIPNIKHIEMVKFQ